MPTRWDPFFHKANYYSRFYKLKNVIQKIIVVACLCLLAFGGVFMVRAYQYDELGYPRIDCLPWQNCPKSCEETPTDEAIIAGAIEAWIAHQPETASVLLESGESASGEVLKYSSIEEFLIINPDCCQFRRGSPRGAAGPVDLNYQRLHDYFGYVEIRYIRRTLLSDGTEHKGNSAGGVLMNSCGVAIE